MSNLLYLVGKYRGVVVDNADPSKLGRIRVRCDEVAGSTPLTWALPCFPVAGNGVGIVSIPPVGAQVLVEFMGARIDAPVWVGGFYGLEDKVPPHVQKDASDPTQMVFLSDGVGIVITGGESGGSIKLICGDGPSITLSSAGIEISAAGKSVTVTGSPITLNGEALRIEG